MQHAPALQEAGIDAGNGEGADDHFLPATPAPKRTLAQLHPHHSPIHTPLFTDDASTLTSSTMDDAAAAVAAATAASSIPSPHPVIIIIRPTFHRSFSSYPPSSSSCLLFVSYLGRGRANVNEIQRDDGNNQQ